MSFSSVFSLYLSFLVYLIGSSLFSCCILTYCWASAYWLECTYFPSTLPFYLDHHLSTVLPLFNNPDGFRLSSRFSHILWSFCSLPPWTMKLCPFESDLLVYYMFRYSSFFDIRSHLSLPPFGPRNLLRIFSPPYPAALPGVVLVL